MYTRKLPLHRLFCLQKFIKSDKTFLEKEPLPSEKKTIAEARSADGFRSPKLVFQGAKNPSTHNVMPSQNGDHWRCPPRLVRDAVLHDGDLDFFRGGFDGVGGQAYVLRPACRFPARLSLGLVKTSMT